MLDAVRRRKEDADHRADFRAGMVCSILANQWLETGRKPYEPGDFMPGLKSARRRPPRPQTLEEQLAVIKQAHRAMGGDMAAFEKN